MKDLSYYRRGQVYFLCGNKEAKDSIQGGKRPVLIVSNDLCNANSPVIHVAPITSQVKSPLPTHVCYNTEKVTCTILCEQITARSVKDFEQSGSYEYTLSEEIMSKVDRAIAVQFNIQGSPLHIKDFEEALEKIKKLKLEELHEEVERLTEERVSHILDRMRVDFNIEPSNIVPKEDTLLEKLREKDPVEDKSPASRVEKFNKKYSKFLKEESLNPVEEKKKSRKVSKWTTELKAQLINDYYQMTAISEVSAKYKISIGSVRTYVSKFEKEFRESSEPVVESGVVDIKNSAIPETRGQKEEFLSNFKSMTLSSFMELYGLTDRKETILLADKIKSEIR